MIDKKHIFLFPLDLSIHTSYNCMFKKRVPKAKNIDLHQETDLIVTLPIPEPEASPSENNNPSEQVKERSASRTPIYKRKPNNNVITLEALEVEESKRAFPS